MEQGRAADVLDEVEQVGEPRRVVADTRRRRVPGGERPGEGAAEGVPEHGGPTGDHVEPGEVVEGRGAVGDGERERSGRAELRNPRLSAPRSRVGTVRAQMLGPRAHWLVTETGAAAVRAATDEPR